MRQGDGGVDRLDRIVRVMELVSQQGREGASLTQIGYVLELPKASLYRLVADMEQAGLLTHNARVNRYFLSWRVFEWATAYYAQTSYVEVLQEAVTTLTQDVQLFSYAAVLQGGRLFSVAVATPRSFYPVYVKLGARVPLRGSAPGKVLLAQFPPERVTAWFEQEERELGFWTPTPYTQSVTTLQQEMPQIHQQGWALCRDELELGNSAIAIPVGTPPWWVSLTIVAPTLVVAERTQELLAALRAVGQRISSPLDMARVVDNEGIEP
ncbi:MAG: hypothetical protein C7B44_02320 [Sulfobacillus thermosulfidooxidans]|nr:MAG: hypothetical protein C7B44_02320 [Sulfobacillus thermosulfidooxidans]